MNNEAMNNEQTRPTLIVDADDTLWETEIYFEQCIADFGALMATLGFDREEAERTVETVERERVPRVGYAPQEFARSLVFAYQRLCERHGRAVKDEVSDSVWEIGRAMVAYPIVLLDGVAETLARLSDHCRLLLLTKGDGETQADKLARSGLGHLFDGVHVVPEKDAGVIRGLVAEYDLRPEQTWMVGNSPRSDVNPALEAGIGAIHVPHSNTWHLEHEEIAEPERVIVLSNFEELDEMFLQAKRRRKDVIKAVIFDFGGVLMRTVNPLPRRELEHRFGLPPGGADKLVFESPRRDDVRLGRISNAAIWDDVGRRLELDAESLAEFRQTFWAGSRLDEELVALIRHLHDAGYRTALLSNAPDDLAQSVEQLGISSAFDVIVISGCEGLAKPDPAIFQLALERLGVPAEGAVFVDDLRVNVAAARQVGLHATRFQGLSPLRRWLRGLGVPVPDPVPNPLPDVRAVIFDWGGVMEASPDDAHITAWERRLGLEADMLPEALWGEVWRQLSVGAITNDDYVQRIAGQLGLPDAEAAGRFIKEFYAGDRLNPDVIAAVRALRGRYKVALLTNASPGQDDHVRERLGIDVHTEFDVYVNSAHVGLRKPDPAIFHLTLDRLGVAPQQAIFLDDLLRNVDSARALGIHTVQFVDPATSLAELEALLDTRLADLRFGDFR
jgi:putative hydrolase of the HAD superfamily